MRVFILFCFGYRLRQVFVRQGITPGYNKNSYEDQHIEYYLTS
jgi:hypothetical protein